MKTGAKQPARSIAIRSVTGATAVLYLPDWSAFVCNCLGGEEGAIRAAFAIFVDILRVRQPELMQKVWS